MKERQNEKILKVSFFGPSGSGKSTSARLIGEKNLLPDYKIIQANVAKPLHEIQAHAYELFNIPNTGQDGALLQFLAKHFEEHLGTTCVANIKFQLNKEENKDKNIFFLNSDCRQNAYFALKKNGFVFIRVFTNFETIKERKGIRGDISNINEAERVEQIEKMRSDYLLDNNGSLFELEENLKIILEKMIRSGRTLT